MSALPASSVKERRWEAEELEVVCSVPRGGDIASLPYRIHRSYEAIAQKRFDLAAERRLRAACGAFLPDDGTPYRALMVRILREAKAP
jgi:hypothetical protein